MVVLTACMTASSFEHCYIRWSSASSAGEIANHLFFNDQTMPYNACTENDGALVLIDHAFSCMHASVCINVVNFMPQ